MTGVWESETCPVYKAVIYIAGNYEDILRECKNYCTETSYCVSTIRADFPYKYGCEEGAAVTLINYARFPDEEDTILWRARQLALRLAEKLNQGSYTIVGAKDSTYYSRRGDLK